MKKIYVLYAAAGQGHTKAAQVLAAYYAKREPEARIVLLDVLKFSSPFLQKAYREGYNFIIRHAQWLWSVIFYGSSLRLPFGLTEKMHSMSNRLNSPGLFKLLEKEQPDLIISTHFLPSQVCSRLKKQGKIKSCLITVVTDFGVHPFWVAHGTDLYMAASPATARQLERLGVPPAGIRVTGIPVDPSYALVKDRKTLRSELRLPADKFTVLVVTGSFGIGPIEEIARLLHDDCHVLAVCARNTKLYERLKALDLSNVSVYGFVGNMNELMGASDVVVTKPGGLSISELLVVDTVPVFISAIPGQEAENVLALTREGIGTYCRSAEQVRRTVLALKDNPDRLSGIRHLISRVRKPHSVEEIYDAVCACCPGAPG